MNWWCFDTSNEVLPKKEAIDIKLTRVRDLQTALDKFTKLQRWVCFITVKRVTIYPEKDDFSISPFYEFSALCISLVSFNLVQYLLNRLGKIYQSKA